MTSKKQETSLSPVFQEASEGRKPSRKPSPFCLRLTFEERALLEDQAGNRPLGTYIRDQLLGDNADKRQARRRPKADQQMLAQLLAGLKGSRISPNLNQIAKAANCGNILIADEVEEQITEACAAIKAMRDTLFVALGLQLPQRQDK
jgi:hypothetical protein